MEQVEYKQYLYDYIKLFSLYLNNKSAEDLAIDDKMLSFFIKLSKYHSLTAFLYKAIKDTKAKVNEEQLKKLEEWYYSNLRKTVLFEQERQKLYDFLNKNQIDFLPLKGLAIQQYYPDLYAREFADYDILFDPNKDLLVKKFFTTNGYEVKYFRKGVHDVYLKKPFYNFEMHRKLFSPDDKRLKNVSYFDAYSTKSTIKEGFEHYLTNEDFYIYFTMHSYKHYCGSGCGIRTLIDYYVFLKNVDLDFDYIDKELRSLDLVEFSNDIKSLSLKLFDNQEISIKEEEMLLYIADAGTYGTLENSVNKGVQKKGKFRYFMSRIFPPLTLYKNVYPWAYKCRILIPIAWICRFFRILFKNPKKAINEFKLIKKSQVAKEDNE